VVWRSCSVVETLPSGDGGLRTIRAYRGGAWLSTPMGKICFLHTFGLITQGLKLGEIEAVVAWANVPGVPRLDPTPKVLAANRIATDKCRIVPRAMSVSFPSAPVPSVSCRRGSVAYPYNAMVGRPRPPTAVTVTLTLPITVAALAPAQVRIEWWYAEISPREGSR
jgi:hypothetical protein